MSRSLTATNSLLGVWDDGDDAGAGTKGVTVALGGVGLNANWETLDVAVGTEHNADGTHKANKIKGSNLVQSGGDSCVDGSTLEFSSNQIRLKDLGVTTAKINTDAVTAAKLNADCAGTGLDQDTDGSLMVHVDAVTIDFNSDALEVQKDGLPFDLVLYNTQAEAGSGDAATPTEPVWQETGVTSYVQKIICKFVAKAHMKYLKLYAHARTGNASYAWNARLSLYDSQTGSNLHSGTDTGTNTSYDVNGDPECSISVDISGDITAGHVYTAVVELQGTHAGITAYMRSATIMVTSA